MIMRANPSGQAEAKAKAKVKSWMLLKARKNGVIAHEAMLRIAKEIDAQKRSQSSNIIIENIQVS
jgi:hypothetical protein